jgi:hypothetical protein
MGKEITKTLLDDIYDKYDALTNKQQLASELLKTAQDRFGNTELEVERKDGTKTKVIQKFLWKEVMELGMDCDAGKTLRTKHPKVFEAYEQEQELTKDINKTLFATFGIATFNKISFKDILLVIEMVVDYKLKK